MMPERRLLVHKPEAVQRGVHGRAVWTWTFWTKGAWPQETESEAESGLWDAKIVGGKVSKNGSNGAESVCTIWTPIWTRLRRRGAPHFQELKYVGAYLHGDTQGRRGKRCLHHARLVRARGHLRPGVPARKRGELRGVTSPASRLPRAFLRSPGLPSLASPGLLCAS